MLERLHAGIDNRQVNQSATQGIDRGERKPPFFIANTLVAHSVAYVIDRTVGNGLTPDGHKLLKKLVVKLCRGGKISMSQDVPPVYQGASLAIHVKGQEHIPSSGPTIFIGNHTRGGPLNSIGQYFEVAKEGYDGRSGVKDEQVREPFLIMQRGLGKRKLVQYLSGVFYDLAAGSLMPKLWKFRSMMERERL